MPAYPGCPEKRPLNEHHHQRGKQGVGGADLEWVEQLRRQPAAGGDQLRRSTVDQSEAEPAALSPSASTRKSRDQRSPNSRHSPSNNSSKSVSRPSLSGTDCLHCLGSVGRNGIQPVMTECWFVGGGELIGNVFLVSLFKLPTLPPSASSPAALKTQNGLSFW